MLALLSNAPDAELAALLTTRDYSKEQGDKVQPWALEASSRSNTGLRQQKKAKKVMNHFHGK